MTIPYRFAPWARRGLARAHRNADTADGPLAVRPRITIGLTLQARANGTSVAAVSGNVDLTLYGPSDVIGIDPRLIVRTDPRPNVTNFEPNYLAIVDFDPPDFPWLLTPAHAEPADRLRPWLVLVVVERAKVGVPKLISGRPLPSLALRGVDVASELPDLAESWLWAHTQAVSQVAAADRAALSAELNAYPERNISRLVCPRRLEPRTDYVACVVPATDGGRLRGLGQPIAGNTLQPAWSHANPVDVELPVYFHWEFSTGPVGDIETLARRLRTPSQYGGDKALMQQLRHIGEQPVAVDGDHLLFDGVTPSKTVFEGAMVSLDFDPANPDATSLARLQAILNSTDAVAKGTPPADQVPTLSPPIYGGYPAKRHVVDAARTPQHWLDGLNVQPRYRLAAGWGAEVVRQNQDEFMQAAWEQVGDVLAAERALSLARLARDVLKRVESRHLARLPAERLLAVMAPSRARIRVSDTESLHGQMAHATLPPELFDGAMRRLVNPRRATFRMAQWRERAAGVPSVTFQMNALVQTFANASQHLNRVDPNHFVPDGLMGSRSYDAIPLPADPNALVNVMPYTGLDITMTAAQISAIQQQTAAAQRVAATTKKKPPTEGDVWKRGLLTETHAIRVAQLERAAGQPLRGNVVTLIQQSSTSHTEGVLLSVQESGLVSQPLRIDARSGALKAYGSALRVRGARAVRTARIGPSTIAAVPPHALKLYGNAAVFTTLPPSTLGPGAGKTTVDLAGPGQFVAPPQPGGAATITMPPALKDHATLSRYSAAFKDYLQVIAPPAASVPAVSAVDFQTATVVARVRARATPQFTVPARLATMLTLGAQSVAWSGGQLSNPFVSARLDLALAERLRYVIPRTFDRVMAYPHLRFPLSRKLETLAPDVFLPGVGVLPNDFIMAVKTNPRFVEALMLGANHEMGREMLWQGYPTDSRGTPFQRFWQRLDDKDDIAPIHQWTAVPLGQQPASTEMLVLLIRGQLLERFPNLSIYAYPFVGTEKRPGGSSPPPAPGVVDPSEMDPAKVVLPVMHGHLNKDITYVGFPIAPVKIAQFFFVIEEHMTEPRFGFDEPDNDNQQANTWLQIDWSEVGVAAGSYFGSAALKSASPATGPRWTNPHAATVADALLQRPFRGYWKGQALTVPKP